MRATRANPETQGGGPDGLRMRQGAGMAGAWHGRRIRRPYGQTGHCIIARNTSATGKQHGGHCLPPAKQKARPLQAARSGKSCLFSLDRAGGANALAGTAIDAGSSCSIIDASQFELEEKVVSIKRVTKVVKGVVTSVSQL